MKRLNRNSEIEWLIGLKFSLGARGSWKEEKEEEESE